MGCLSLPVQQKVLALCYLLGSSALYAYEFPETKAIAGVEVPLQGKGIRTVTMFDIKVYAMAFYAQQAISSATAPELEKRPMCFDFVFLRDVDHTDVDRAWEHQFKQSSIYPYADLKAHVELVKKAFGETKEKWSQTFTLLSDKTLLLENGVLKEQILGREFQKNFLSLWFGKKTQSEELQAKLMKKKDS